MFKNALVSVSDKKNLSSFLKFFVKEEIRIVSSGGTAKHLEEKGFKVVKVEEQTLFPEVLGGRVKTLHPFIHIPLLQRTEIEEDQRTLAKYNLGAFDLVVVNLYPFKQSLEKKLKPEEMIEMIDIGGVTLLRAGAKNFENVTVVCDPDDYPWIGAKGNTTLEERKKLAVKVFRHIQNYDQMIADFLESDCLPTENFHPLPSSQKKTSIIPDNSINENSSLKLFGNLHKPLRYGENPQQKAQWFQFKDRGLHNAEIHQGKELSYNNLLDLDSALQALRLFKDRPAVVSVKHNNPCGVAEAKTLEQALQLSLSADPVSVFGGVVALNGKINENCAKQLIEIFLEVVIAPEIDSKACKILEKKKNLRVLIWKDLLCSGPRINIRSLDGGFLTQTEDHINASVSDWKVVSGELASVDQKGLDFAWRVCSCLKSNAIAVTSTNRSLGLGMGQVNRVSAVKQAFERASQFHPNEKSLYLASDAFFPFPDSVELAVKNGVKAIVQPGGSIKDNEVITMAKDLGVPMAFTGERHFRH